MNKGKYSFISNKIPDELKFGTSKPDSKELKPIQFYYGGLVCWMIAHGERVLCQVSEEHDEYFIRYPIVWSKFEDCEKWMDSGTMLDIVKMQKKKFRVGFAREFLKLKKTDGQE